jgi:hypothetical protein
MSAMMRDPVRFTERAQAGASVEAYDVMRYRVKWRAELFYGKQWKNPDGTTNRPDLIAETTGNLLLRGGASLIWETLRGAGTTATTAAKKYFNATAALGVGNSTAAAAATQTALQGGSQSYKALTGGFPTHTTGSTAATVVDIVYKSTWGLSEGNFAWNEFALANKATTANRRLFNRKQQALITKTSAASATLQVTFSAA